MAFPLTVSTQYWELNYHQLLRIITKSLLTLRGEWFIINSLYLHRAWEFYTNSTDWQTFTMMAWEQDFPGIFDKLLKQFNVSIIHWRFAHSVWKHKIDLHRVNIFQSNSRQAQPKASATFPPHLPSPHRPGIIEIAPPASWTVLTILHLVIGQQIWRGNQLSQFAIILSLQSK